MLQPFHNDESFMRPILAIHDAIGPVWIEKIRHKIKWVKPRMILRLQHTGALKFRETLEFTPRQTSKEVDDGMSCRSRCSAQKSTNQRRARGYDCQIKLHSTSRYVLHTIIS